MRKLTRKQILARLFVGFFTLGSLLCTVNSAVAGGGTYGKYKINDDLEWQTLNSEIKPSGSCNSVVVEISGPDSPAPTIYSGYAASDGDIKNNKLTITTKEGVTTKLSNVYGGYVGGKGSATENKVTIASSTTGAVYGGWVYSGSANQNEVHIDSSTANSVYGGYVNSTGNALENIVDIASSTVKSFVYGGDVIGTGSATQNEVHIASSTIAGDVFGGHVASGSATLNEVYIASSTVRAVYGGKSSNGNADSNEVNIIASSTVNGAVYGGRSSSGNADSNEVKITNSSVAGTVNGGYVYNTGSANSNTVTIKDSIASDSTIYGGYTNNGDANSNTVEITNSKTATVWGGYIKSESATGNTNSNTLKLTNSEVVSGNIVAAMNNGTGDAVSNTVEVSGGIINNAQIFGAQLNSGNAILNTVTISDWDSAATDTYIVGGLVDINGNAYSNAVTLDNIEKLDVNLVAGGQTKSGEAASNTVTIKNSTVTGHVYGGFTTSGYADENIIKINDGSTVTGDVSSGYVKGDGNATDNTVEISGGSTVTGFVYGGYVGGNGKATNNTVEISGGSEVKGSVYGGDATGDAVTGNKLIISGAGNTIGGKIENFETMTFDAADVKKDETMLSLTTESSFTFGVKSIETNNADLAVGEKITLISSEVDNIYDGITFKIDGKQAIRDGNNFIANVAKEDSDKVVHVDELAYVKEDNNLNLCKTTGFITGLYNGFDAEGAKQTLGQAEMTVSSVPENVTEIYGAYSEDADVVAGGATINLETTELSDVDLIGSYNLKDETKVDTSNNTLNVNVSGVKVKCLEGFSNLNFKLALDEKAMLDISDSYDMNGISFNSILPEDGFVGTQTILKTGSLTNDSSAKFKINDEEVGSTKTLTITTRNSDSVVYGTYTYGISSEIITLTGKSIVSAVNINSGETKAADNNTLKVTGKMAEKYTELYGAFNADGGAATDAVVDLSEAVSNENLTIYGGYSTGSGADVTTGNVLNVSKNGNKVKNILNFSTLDFTLGSDIAAGTTMLSTVDKVALGGASVNTEMSGIILAKGEKIVLLDNADKGNAELKLNGSTGDQTVAEENSSFVAVSSVGYNTNDNKIAIECKDAFAAGCYIDEKGKLGKDTLTLGSSAASNMRAGYERASEAAPDMSKYSDIYGVYSAGSANPTGATVEIVSAIDYSNTVLHGGYSAKRKSYNADGNILNVNTIGAKVKGITDFEAMNFNLPAETKNGDTMLKVTDEVDMAPTKSVDVEASKATGLKAGDSVNLIDSDAGIKNFGTQKVTVSGLTDKTGEVKVDDKALVLALDKNGEKPNKNTKAPVEAVSATMALVNQASALASSKLNKSMIAAVASANGGSATFASMNGGHSKYETGSYVEADSWNIGFGLAKKGMSSKNPDSTYGLFFQYGKSNFDTHNDGGFRGDGDSKMFGAGLTFHHEARSRYYYHGNVFAGKVDAKWNCAEGGYDDKATYYGMTFGMGRKHNAGGNKTMDIYGRYAFNHVGSMNGDLNGLKYDFDSTSSHNLRLGLRMEYSQKNAATAYWGLAWEHEFAGDSKATVATLGRTDSPTLNGNTGIAEVGYEWKRGDWNYSINAEGSFGKREGVTGSFNINYNF